MTILISYDGSATANSAIVEASKLLPVGASAVVLTVWEPLVVQALRAAKFGYAAVPTHAAEEDEASAASARHLAEHGARIAGEAGFDARPLWVADDRTVATTIIEAAAELDAGLIVMGARGLSGTRAFIGSVSNRVLQHGHLPLLVVPDAGRAPSDAAAPEEAVVAHA